MGHPDRSRDGHRKPTRRRSSGWFPIGIRTDRPALPTARHQPHRPHSGEKGDRATAEDLAQETFVKAYLKLAAFDTTRRLSSWLFRIAHNTAIDSLRRARLTLVSVDDPAADPEIQGHLPTPPTPPDPVEVEALGRALHQALNALRYEHRVAVMLRYEEGLPFEEIGQVLGVPEVTARSFVHRARKQLAELLTAGGWQPSGA